MNETGEGGEGLVKALMLMRKRSRGHLHRSVLYAAARYIEKVEKCGCRYCDESDESYETVRESVDRNDDRLSVLALKVRRLEGSDDDPSLADKVESWVSGLNSRVKRIDQAVTALWCEHVRNLRREREELGDDVCVSRHSSDCGSVGDGTAPVEPGSQSTDASEDPEQPG